MYVKYILNLLLLVLTIVLVSACGNSTSNPVITHESVSTATYKIEYIPVSSAAEGKSTYKLRLTNKATGTAVPGKTITLAPTMTMTTMTHSTPFKALTDNGDGTYTGSIYYVMASVAADGSSMGTWNLAFTVDGETATFHPSVAMAMGRVVKLKGINDKIGGMMGSSSPRTYQIFNDGISGSSVKFFITAADDAAMMTFPAVSVGTVLHDQMNATMPVTAMTVEVSTDKTNWTPLTDNDNGKWSAVFGTMLTAGSHLYVKVTVNSEQKTTDGAAVAAGNTNAYGDFTISGM